jgi:hypothetical protein
MEGPLNRKQEVRMTTRIAFSACPDAGQGRGILLLPSCRAIALYPDPLLAQVLMASTYPLEVVQADRWAKANKKR